MPRTRHWMRSGIGILMRCHPRRPTSTGSSTSSENDVLVCERINGSIGCSVSPASGSFLVNTARPSAAETPQRNAANAMNKYPRKGCTDFGLDVGEFRFQVPSPMMGPDQGTGQDVRDQTR